MDYVLFKITVDAFREKRIDRKTFIERWANIQRMTGLWRVGKW
jgi:hypothetical protein